MLGFQLLFFRDLDPQQGEGDIIILSVPDLEHVLRRVRQDAESVPGQGQGGRPETANNLVVAKKPEKTAQGAKEKGRSDSRKTQQRRSPSEK